MPADYGVHEVGGTVLPLVSPGTNTLLQDADPFSFYFIDFCSFLLNNYLGQRIANEAAAISLTSVTNAVKKGFPYDPTEYLTQFQLTDFPSFFLSRTRSSYTRKRIGWETDHCEFLLAWVMPPLTAAQAERLLPIRRTVAETLRKLTTQSFDPGYTPPGGTLGQTPFGLQFMAIEEIGFTGDRYGMLPGMGNLMFPALLMEGYVDERDMRPPAAQSGRSKFAGGDITVNLTSPDGSTVPTLVQASTQQAPVVQALNTTTGSQAGGTSTTIIGALFLQTPKVYFGGRLAQNIVWVNSTTLTCTSPPASGGGVVPVTVANRDGQTGTLANAFTYTTP